jgi:hypothetical protein
LSSGVDKSIKETELNYNIERMKCNTKQITIQCSNVQLEVRFPREKLRMTNTEEKQTKSAI